MTAFPFVKSLVQSHEARRDINLQTYEEMPLLVYSVA